MNVLVYLFSILCVSCIAIVQIMFKMSAIEVNIAGTIFARRPLLFFSGSILLYIVTSIGWIVILRGADLGKLYPLMALTFVLVPIGTHFLFQEKFSNGYFVGSSLIIIGLILVFTTNK